MSTERLMAERLGLPIHDEINFFSFVRDKISIIPYLFAKQRRILPLEENKEGIIVAVADPLDLDSIDELRLLLKKIIVPIYCPKGTIEAAIEKCYQQKEEETKRFFSDLHKESGALAVEEGKDEYDLLEQSDVNPVVRNVKKITKNKTKKQEH